MKQQERKFADIRQGFGGTCRPTLDDLPQGMKWNLLYEEPLFKLKLPRATRLLHRPHHYFSNFNPHTCYGDSRNVTGVTALFKLIDRLIISNLLVTFAFASIGILNRKESTLKGSPVYAWHHIIAVLSLLWGEYIGLQHWNCQANTYNHTHTVPPLPHLQNAMWRQTS